LDRPGTRHLSTPPSKGEAPHPAFAVGQVVAEKFVIQRVIGDGGLAVVLAAKHLALDQVVAIKCLRPSAMEKSVVVERFLREARLAAKISSDHVVRVFDVGRTAEGIPFMVMELLDGIDLRRTVETGPLPFAEAVDYVLQACEALAEAHVAGIVHRDLKPENLFLAKRAAGSSIVKVLDFGISKYVPMTHDPNALRTQPAQFFGTPLYMSPEQLRSPTEVDARTDIWALGVTLFELVTGRLPFFAENLPQLCTVIASGRHLSLRQFRPDAPQNIELVIDKCLAKDPAERFQNVAELANELSLFGRSESVPRMKHVVAVIQQSGQSVHPPRLLTPVPSGVHTDPSVGTPIPSGHVVPSSGNPTPNSARLVMGRTPSGASSDIPPAPSSRVALAIGIPCVVLVGLVLGYGPLLRAAHVKAPPQVVSADTKAIESSAPAALDPGPSSTPLSTPPAGLVPSTAVADAPPVPSPPTLTNIVPSGPAPTPPPRPSWPSPPRIKAPVQAATTPSAPATPEATTTLTAPAASSSSNTPNRRKFRTEF
jgi:serine/threonine-protein kinase